MKTSDVMALFSRAIVHRLSIADECVEIEIGAGVLRIKPSDFYDLKVTMLRKEEQTLSHSELQPWLRLQKIREVSTDDSGVVTIEFQNGESLEIDNRGHATVYRATILTEEPVR